MRDLRKDQGLTEDHLELLYSVVSFADELNVDVTDEESEDIFEGFDPDDDPFGEFETGSSEEEDDSPYSGELNLNPFGTVEYSSTYDSPYSGELDEEIPPKEKLKQFAKSVGIAPFYLVLEVGKSLRNRKLSDAKGYLQTVSKVSLGFTLFYGILWILGNDLFILPSLMTIIMSFTMFIVTFGILQTKWLEPEPIPVMGEEETEEEETVEEEIIEEDDIFDTDEDNVFDDDEIFDDEEEYSEEDNYVAEEIDEDEFYDEDEDEKPLKEVFIDDKTSDRQFTEVLLNALKSARHKRNIDYRNREQILKSFEDFLIGNTPNFHKWKVLAKRKRVSNNLLFFLVRGLREIFGQDNLYRVTVYDMEENPLMYKVTMNLNQRGKYYATLVSSLSEIENQFKKDSFDKEVEVLVDRASDKVTFKILKSEGIIVTFGDAIRYGNAYQELLNPKNDMPFLLGLENHIAPFVIDLSKDTNMTIVGDSGGGKSWFIYLLIINLILTNSPADVSFIFLDRKNSTIFNSLGRFPHALGYTSNVEIYMDIIDALTLEVAQRKKILEKTNAEDWAAVRRLYKNETNNLPWLYVFIDELASTLEDFKTRDKNNLHDPFVSKLVAIAKESRSLGIKIIPIAQRAINNDIPRGIVTQSSFKAAFNIFKLDLEKIQMWTPEVKPPTKKGMALIKYVGTANPIPTRTLGIGGLNNDQVLDFVRALSLEWQLRNPELPKLAKEFEIIDYRAKVRQKVLEEYKEKKIFTYQIMEGVNINEVVLDARNSDTTFSPMENESDGFDPRKVKINYSQDSRKQPRIPEERIDEVDDIFDSDPLDELCEDIFDTDEEDIFDTDEDDIFATGQDDIFDTDEEDCIEEDYIEDDFTEVEISEGEYLFSHEGELIEEEEAYVEEPIRKELPIKRGKIDLIGRLRQKAEKENPVEEKIEKIDQIEKVERVVRPKEEIEKPTHDKPTSSNKPVQNNSSTSVRNTGLNRLGGRNTTTRKSSQKELTIPADEEHRRPAKIKPKVQSGNPAVTKQSIHKHAKILESYILKKGGSISQDEIYRTFPKEVIEYAIQNIMIVRSGNGDYRA